MKHYLTFEEAELGSTITSLGYNLHRIADHIIYFKQYVKLHGVEHNFLPDSAILKVNKCLTILKHDFNLPIESNTCLDQIENNQIEEIINRCNYDHDNPYKKQFLSYRN